MTTLDFSGKRLWVTGAGRGIGLRIAQQLHELGADVVGLDRQFDQAEYPFRTTLLDISDHQQVQDVCRKLLDEQPHLDGLINAAGALRLGNSDALSLDDWHTCMDVNVSGAFYLFRQLVPLWKRQRSGVVVCVASNAAHVPRMGMAAYCASKAALVSLSHCVGLELAPYGVRCNLVSPGSTDTDMLRQLWKTPEDAQRTIDGSMDQYKLGIPLGKLATVDEIANAVVFLASDLASHITMQDLVVDGGATLAA